MLALQERTNVRYVLMMNTNDHLYGDNKSDIKGDPGQGEDEHQQADHDRLCGEHINCHGSHIQPVALDQTQVILKTPIFQVFHCKHIHYHGSRVFTHSTTLKTQVTSNAPPKKHVST